MNSSISYSAAVLDPDNWAFQNLEHRAPSLLLEEKSLFLEPGRVLDNVCYRAYCFRVVQPEFGDYVLRVKHGGGEESWRLGWNKRFIASLDSMDSDARFATLFALMDAHHKSERQTCEKRDVFWRQAAAEKRIKTRQVKDGVKVWIEDKT